MVLISGDRKVNKEESDLIIAEQNKNTEEILKAVAKVKSNYQALYDLKDIRIAELEKENAELKDNFKIAKDNEYEYSSLLIKAKEFLSWWVNHCGDHDLFYAEKTEQFLKGVEECPFCKGTGKFEAEKKEK
jgi:N-acetylmuramoyl-L-alanine amidase CwlA